MAEETGLEEDWNSLWCSMTKTLIAEGQRCGPLLCVCVCVCLCAVCSRFLVYLQYKDIAYHAVWRKLVSWLCLPWFTCQMISSLCACCDSIYFCLHYVRKLNNDFFCLHPRRVNCCRCLSTSRPNKQSLYNTPTFHSAVSFHTFFSANKKFMMCLAPREPLLLLPPSQHLLFLLCFCSCMSLLLHGVCVCVSGKTVRCEPWDSLVGNPEGKQLSLITANILLMGLSFYHYLSSFSRVSVYTGSLQNWI